jgi:hypothetical protein
MSASLRGEGTGMVECARTVRDLAPEAAGESR